MTVNMLGCSKRFSSRFLFCCIFFLGAAWSENSSAAKSRFLYVMGDESISTYAVNSDTGENTYKGVTKLGNRQRPSGFVISPTGKFAYVVSNASHTISVFAVDPTGVLRSSDAIKPMEMHGRYVWSDSTVIEPKGRFLYVFFVDGSLRAFPIDPATGALKWNDDNPILGAPNDNSSYTRLHFEPEGRFAYLSDPESGTISSYEITDNGKLKLNTRFSPYSFSQLETIFTRNGKVMYSNDNSNIFTYHVSGEKIESKIDKFPVPDFSAKTMTVDSTGKFAYVAGNDDSILAFSMDPTIKLIQQVAYPEWVPMGNTGVSLITAGKFLYAIRKKYSVGIFIFKITESGKLQLTTNGFTSGEYHDLIFYIAISPEIDNMSMR